MSIWVFCPFFKWVFCFDAIKYHKLIVNFGDWFLITWFVNILSQSMGCFLFCLLFTFLCKIFLFCNLLNSLNSSSNFLVMFLGFSTCSIVSSAKVRLLLLLFQSGFPLFLFLHWFLHKIWMRSLLGYFLPSFLVYPATPFWSTEFQMKNQLLKLCGFPWILLVAFPLLLLRIFFLCVVFLFVFFCCCCCCCFIVWLIFVLVCFSFDLSFMELFRFSGLRWLFPFLY